MSWISTRELADVIFYALLNQPSNSQQQQLRVSADHQLCQWKREAMNFGDCASQLITAAFNFEGNKFQNPYFGCSSPHNNNNTYANNHQAPSNNSQVALALSAALMLDDVASPAKWIEAQLFSDKDHVISVLHRVAFYSRPYSSSSSNDDRQDPPKNPNANFEIPNILKVALNKSTSLPIEFKVAKIALNSLAGIAVAEFPNSNWVNFIYGVTKTSTSSGSALLSLSSSSGYHHNHNKNNDKNNSRDPSMPCPGGSPNQQSQQQQQQQQNSQLPASPRPMDVPLSRRYLWMYYVSQRLAALPAAESLTDARIGFRLALLDFLEDGMKRQRQEQEQGLPDESSSPSSSIDEAVLQWKIARILLLQLPASKRQNYPVVRSLVSEAARRTFCVLDDENDSTGVKNNFSSSSSSTFSLIPASWQNPNAMSVVRDQILLLKPAPAQMAVEPLSRLLMRSIAPAPDDGGGQNGLPRSLVRKLPGPLWKCAFEVLLHFVEQNSQDEDDLRKFCSNFVPMDVLVRILAHTLAVAPGSDEVFAVPRHKALLSSEEANDDDVDEICSPSDFAVVLSTVSSRSATMNWRATTALDRVSSRLCNFYGASGEEYFAARERSLVNDVKELDSGVTGSAAGSLSSCCVAMIEMLVEGAPQEASNLIGKVVAAELLPFGVSDGGNLIAAVLNRTNRDSVEDDDEKSRYDDDECNRTSFLLSNIHGVCTLLLAAFRVFNINGSSTFCKAVCDKRDAEFLLDRLMDICIGLISSAFDVTNQSQVTRSGNNNRNSCSENSKMWDLVHAASRLLVVGCILCEGSADESVMNKFAGEICLKVLASSVDGASDHSSNVLLLHSSSLYCLFRLCLKSPAIRSRITLALFQQPESVPIFVKIIKNNNNSNNNNLGNGSNDESQQIEERLPFTCFAIAELTSTILALGAPDHVHQIWQSERFFTGFLSSLVLTLTEGSLQVGGIVSQSLKKILDLIVSDHGENRRSCCVQVQTILTPVIRRLLFREKSGRCGDNDDVCAIPAARIVCECLKDLFVNMSDTCSSSCSTSSTLEDEDDEDEKREGQPAHHLHLLHHHRQQRQQHQQEQCSCVSSLYKLPFALFTQQVAMSEAEANVTDANIRFTSYCVATLCASSAACSFFCGESASHDDLQQQQQQQRVIDISVDLLIRQVNLYQKVIHLPSSVTSTTSASLLTTTNNTNTNNSKLLSRTISIWGFASAFCLRKLHSIGHPNGTATEPLVALTKNLISHVCSFLRVSTKDADLSGLCYLVAVIGSGLSLEAVTLAMKQVTARDASLFWSLWCTVACEMTSRREFAPIDHLWNVWMRNNNNNDNNDGNNSSLLNLRVPLDIFVLAPCLIAGSRKASKNSVVADDFARLGKHLSSPLEAIQFVFDFRNNSPDFRNLPKKTVLFSEDCFAKLFR